MKKKIITNHISINESFEFLDYQPPDDKPSSDDADDGTIVVKHDAFWSYCGPLLSGAAADLPDNLHEWAASALSSSLLPLLLPFLAFANEFIRSRGLDHYWVTIRATKATREFDRPRWHTDELFFSSSSSGGFRAMPQPPSPRPRRKKQQQQQPLDLDLQTDWKICTTLLGPPTLFIPAVYQARARAMQRATRRALAPAADHACTSIRCVGCAAAADAVRERLAGQLAPLGRVQAGPGKCAFFRIGQDAGAVHSEPRMGEGDRIFVNVVPGRRDELGALMTKWGMSFPRSWETGGRESGRWEGIRLR
ncbi:hypothetical protein F4775DRAFT_586563 [Biscogniauxia sp. FL1348]|nr:hypothetical protein F4775DRAFT_586563 [Biscogniauxia sp. FL1348]